MADSVEPWAIDVCRVYRPWWWPFKMRHEHVVLRKECAWEDADRMLRELRRDHPKFTFTLTSGGDDD